MAVYLIGGPPKCGKTTLAKELSKKLSIPWISADTLQNIVYAYMGQEDHEKNFPHSYLKGGSNDETYADNSSNAIVEAYIRQGETSYKAISMTAETQIVDGDDYIIEGYQVTPEIVDEIIKKFGIENIKTIFLVKHDEEKFVEDIDKSSTPNDWIVRKTKKTETFQKIAKMISDYSKYFEAEAKKYGFKVLKMDQGFEDQIEKAISSLTAPSEHQETREKRVKMIK